MQNINDLKKRLKELIAKNELPKVFKLFNEALAADSSISNTNTSLQGQYHSMRNKQHQGIVDDDFAERTFNRIRIALTEITDKLELEDLLPSFFESLSANGQNNQPVNLSNLEQQGLENQLDLLQKKLNFLLAQQAILSDPAQKFTVQMQIDETQKQVDEVKSKLGR